MSKHFPNIDQLVRVLSQGAPVDVHVGGDLDAELAHGNHPSAARHQAAIAEKLLSDVVLGRAIFFDIRFISEVLGFCASPLGVVEEPYASDISSVKLFSYGGMKY